MRHPYGSITPQMAKQATLRWVNRIRIAHQLDSFNDLPQGNRGNVSSCVIANAIWEDCRVTGQYMHIGERKFVMPICAKAFVYYFDTGKMPELIKKSDEQLEKVSLEAIKSVYAESVTKDEAVEGIESLIREEVHDEAWIKVNS